MKEKKKVLVISVHPDDETLGCGGSILKHLGQGDEVHCVFITGGNIYQSQLIDYINTLYGFTSIITLGFKELHLHEMLNELIEALSSIDRSSSSVVYSQSFRCSFRPSSCL